MPVAEALRAPEPFFSDKEELLFEDELAAFKPNVELVVEEPEPARVAEKACALEAAAAAPLSASPMPTAPTAAELGYAASGKAEVVSVVSGCEPVLATASRESSAVASEVKPVDTARAVAASEDLSSEVNTTAVPEADADMASKTFRSGVAYHFDREERRRAGKKRIEQLQEEVGTEPLVGFEARPAFRFFKRAFDIAFSGVVLVCFCWLFAIIAVLVKLDDPKGPVFFKQQRVGKNGKEFTMLKFRTMCVDAEDRLAELMALNEKTGPVFKIAEDPRITHVGKWLRKLSLDELPQFINVLLGHMSVVGPRPALPNEVAAYNDYQKQRLMVKPGLTCYWQTRRNRDSITFDEWVALDLLYVKKGSPWSDAKLVVQTIGVVLTAQGS